MCWYVLRTSVGGCLLGYMMLWLSEVLDFTGWWVLPFWCITFYILVLLWLVMFNGKQRDWVWVIVILYFVGIAIASVYILLYFHNHPEPWEKYIQ